MTQSIRLDSGPHAGTLNINGTPNALIGLGVDEHLRPAAGDQFYAIALYGIRPRRASGFRFPRISAPEGQPFPVEFTGGPCQGIVPFPQPDPVLSPELRFGLGQDGKPFDGKEVPNAVAVYERGHDGTKCHYCLKEIDLSSEALEPLIEEINERRLTEAINNFYVQPNYESYSIKPTGEHTQVAIEVGHRRGQVDEKIAPLIAEVWCLGLDTTGSCQQRPIGTPNDGKAYIAFPRLRHARFFHDCLVRAHIPSEFVEKKFRIAHHRNPQEEASEVIEFDCANILFEHDAISVIVELLRRTAPQV